jgi:hypothetical protein
VRRELQIAAPWPARKTHEMPGAAAVGRAEAARAARSAGQGRQSPGELAFARSAVHEPGAARRKAPQKLEKAR